MNPKRPGAGGGFGQRPPQTLSEVLNVLLLSHSFIKPIRSTEDRRPCEEKGIEKVHGLSISENQLFRASSERNPRIQESKNPRNGPTSTWIPEFLDSWIP